MAERARGGNARRLLHQPIRQPGESAGPRAARPGRRSGSRWSTSSTRSSAASARGGTITGPDAFLRQHRASRSKLVLADPVGSVLAEYVTSGKIGTAGSWVVEGIGEDFVPPIADLSRRQAAYAISDAESIATARELLRAEGIFGRLVVGTLLAAALRYCREQTAPKRVVTFVCDTGTRTCRRCTTIMDGRPGPARSASAGRPARPDRAPLRRRDVVTSGRTTR